MNHTLHQCFTVFVSSCWQNYELYLYLYNFDSKFILGVGLQVINHAVQIGGIEVLVAWIVGIVRWRVAHHIVSIVCHKL